ncbi:MAG: methyl-accepting chemotaxis protein [Phycisphaerales bacterium]|nr:methyl-accepting chemotaxis protein [Phycisphaerales bacterium]
MLVLMRRMGHPDEVLGTALVSPELKSPDGSTTMSNDTKSKKFALGLSTKIIAATLTVMVAVVAVNYTIFLNGYRDSAQEAMVARAAAFTAVADEAKNDAASKFLNKEINVDELLAEALEQIDNGTAYSETRYFSSIPVMVGWTSGAKAAEKEGLEFNVVSLEARNPDNAPIAGGFRDEMIHDLTDAYKRDGTTQMNRINEETNTMHYMRAITLDESCMTCHGDPSKYDERDAEGDYDGKDALGFRMESWDPGYMHGAYELQMPLSIVDAKVAGFFRHGMMFTVPLIIVAGLGLIFLLRSMLTKPLNATIAMIKDVATGDGDLTKRLDLNRADEIGKLGHWFDMFLENLHGIISQMRDSSQAVASAATEIAASADEMAVGLQTQEQQTQQVAAAVEELSQSVTEVAAKSADATQASEQSQHLAEDGGKIVSSTIEEMRGIATEVRGSAETINALGVQSEKIGEIIAVINDIADQTNLLALNAAIEAARAGEHGRGFAVVADEVRKLAERTTTATEEVSSSIIGIQKETTSAVTLIEAGSERVGRGVELASEAGAALESIVSGSESLQSMVQDIAAAANQQSAASGEIARAVEGIDSITRQSSQGAAQSAEAAGDLAHQAEQMQSLVNKFKLD